MARGAWAGYPCPMLHREGNRRLGTLVVASSLLAAGCGGGDELLSHATEPAAPTGGAPAVGGGVEGEGLPAAAVFRDDRALEYHLTLSETDRLHLEELGNDERYVPADLIVRGDEIGDLALGTVGLRHKGAWTLHHCWDDFGGVRSYAEECAKLSFKLDFAEYAPERRFQGLKKLNLHAASGDGAKLRELLGYGLFRDFGVDAPRVAPAQVFVNGEPAGLFLAVEAIDGRYTKFRFPKSGDGNLYKEIWPQPGLSDSHYLRALQTNEEVGDVSDIQGFAAAIGEATTETLPDRLAPWVEIESLLRYVAVDRAIKNWDGIMSFYSPYSPHNFYWYRDDGPDRRFRLIPWDLDNVFWSFDPYMAPEQWVDADPVPDFNEIPRSCEPRSIWDRSFAETLTPPGCDPLLRMLAAGQWERLVELGEDLLAGPLQVAVLEPRLAAWEATLAPLVASDPHLDATSWAHEVALLREALTRAVEDFRAFLAAGYHEEPVTEGPELLPEPDPSLRLAPIPEGGLRLGIVNNFEFNGGAVGMPPRETYAGGETGTSQTILWNRRDPLSGAADLRFEFAFSRQPGAWDEWVFLGLGTWSGAAISLAGLQQISLTLRADRRREVRVRLESPAYGDAFGGVWSEFGSVFYLNTEAQTVRLRFDRVNYPDWARAAWGEGQGWTGTDDEALALVLARFGGLIFSPAATTDAAGEMLEPIEEGYLQIDDIYFQ